jgi:hypothetical protein
MEDYRSLSHTKWQCKYHIVFIPKYRKRQLYGVVRKHLGEEITQGSGFGPEVFLLIRLDGIPKPSASTIAEQEMEDRRLDQLETPEITRE